MKALLKNKRGNTDNFFLLSYISIFIIVGLVIPFASSLEGSQTDYNSDQIDDLLGDDTTSDDISGFAIVGSVAKMFFWTFGDLPFWLDAIFLIFRIHFGILIYRQVRGGSG